MKLRVLHALLSKLCTKSNSKRAVPTCGTCAWSIRTRSGLICMEGTSATLPHKLRERKRKRRLRKYEDDACVAYTTTGKW